MAVICVLLWLYQIVLFVRILSSWFPVPSMGPVATVMGVIRGLTDPVLLPLRNLLPPIRLGMVALDLSPIIVFIVLQILLASLC